MSKKSYVEDRLRYLDFFEYLIMHNDRVDQNIAALRRLSFEEQEEFDLERDGDNLAFDIIHAVLMGVVCLNHGLLDDFTYLVNEQTRSLVSYVTDTFNASNVESAITHIPTTDSKEFWNDAIRVASACGIELSA